MGFLAAASQAFFHHSSGALTDVFCLTNARTVLVSSMGHSGCLQQGVNRDTTGMQLEQPLSWHRGEAAEETLKAPLPGSKPRMKAVRVAVMGAVMVQGPTALCSSGNGGTNCVEHSLRRLTWSNLLIRPFQEGEPLGAALVQGTGLTVLMLCGAVALPCGAQSG